MKGIRFLRLTAAAATAIAAMVLYGCSDERQVDGYTDPVEAQFKASIDGSVTRTTGGGDTWVAADGIGIYMIATGGVIPGNVTGGANNVRYNVSNAFTGALEPDATGIFYPQAGSVDFAAYYPYGTPSAAGLLAVDLTSQANHAEIDVLTAKAANLSGATADQVTLVFTHALSKITINIKGSTAADQAAVAAIAAADITLAGMPGSATVNVNGGAAAEGLNSAAPVEMNRSETVTAAYDATFTAIVAPHGARGGRLLTAVVDGNTLTWDFPAADAFTPGNNYVYEATVGNAHLNVSEATIIPWVDIDSGELPLTTQNHRITWDASTGRYTLTTDYTDAGLYFKFGSVVGVYSGNGALHNLTSPAVADPYDITDIAWHPFTTPNPITADWNTIPVYNAVDFALSPNTVTPPAYHNITNVKAGKGDPCRLVGLDLNRIKNTAAASLTAADIDNHTWRMPTNAENRAFAGYDENTPNTTANYWTALGGVNGGMFPSVTAGSSATFLPAMGRRLPIGTVETQGNYGYNWSSEPVNATNGYYLLYYSVSVNPMFSNLYAHGISVRCVRQ